jgi:uncharacterized membrane protein YqiK
MYGTDKKEKKESVLVKYAKHIGISAVVIGALIAIVAAIVLWWLYGYSYVIVPSGETAFEALNATL